MLETFAHQLGGGIELAQAYEAERALDHQREEFLALVSHDLRQPVAAISIVAEGLAKSQQLSRLERDALDGLRDQARSLTVFAEDVLAISLLESGAMKLAPTWFDLAHLASGLARQSAAADCIQVDVPDRPVHVWADATRIGRAVENLLRKRSIARWKLTFLFGLVHGFGFSNVLREMQLPRANLALTLFSFNLGVEIGQIVLVALLFPLTEELIQSGWIRLRPAISIAIGILATFWFIQRAVFG